MFDSVDVVSAALALGDLVAPCAVCGTEHTFSLRSPDFHCTWPSPCLRRRMQDICVVIYRTAPNVANLSVSLITAMQALSAAEFKIGGEILAPFTCAVEKLSCDFEHIHNLLNFNLYGSSVLEWVFESDCIASMLQVMAYSAAALNTPSFLGINPFSSSLAWPLLVDRATLGLYAVECFETGIWVELDWTSLFFRADELFTKVQSALVCTSYGPYATSGEPSSSSVPAWHQVKASIEAVRQAYSFTCHQYMRK